MLGELASTYVNRPRRRDGMPMKGVSAMGLADPKIRRKVVAVDNDLDVQESQSEWH